mgnify:CR=1 FL=1
MASIKGLERRLKRLEEEYLSVLNDITDQQIKSDVHLHARLYALSKQIKIVQDRISKQKKNTRAIERANRNREERKKRRLGR